MFHCNTKKIQKFKNKTLLLYFKQTLFSLCILAHTSSYDSIYRVFISDGIYFSWRLRLASVHHDVWCQAVVISTSALSSWWAHRIKALQLSWSCAYFAIRCISTWTKQDIQFIGSTNTLYMCICIWSHAIRSLNANIKRLTCAASKVSLSISA